MSRPCEAGCPLFVRLPILREAARQAEPMVGSPAGMVRHLLSQIAEATAQGGRIVRRHGARVTRALERLFRD